MILSDREIRLALARGSFRITPFPGANVWSSTAIDLTLDAQILRWKPPGGKRARRTVVSPADPEFDWLALIGGRAETVQIPDGGYEVSPGSFCLGWTVERIQLPHPSRLAARVEGKSSLARLGLGVHVTAPTIHAGFGFKQNDPGYPGTALQLEIWNCGPLAVNLKRGMRICQLVFEEVHGTPEKGYEGRFAVQGPAVPPPPGS
jgi:dCTP deaminase